jgi:hypothetical protein
MAVRWLERALEAWWLAATNRWLTAADASVARCPTKLAFCSRFRRQREAPFNRDPEVWKGDFLWLLGLRSSTRKVQKHSPHKAQKGRRCENRQPSHSAPKLT